MVSPLCPAMCGVAKFRITGGAGMNILQKVKTESEDKAPVVLKTPICYSTRTNHIDEIEDGETLPNSFYKASITLIPKPVRGIINKENYRIFTEIGVKITSKVLTNWM